ncbi:MAG TPA: sugar phosphate isomerase/epimerase [Ktedonobacteraceae bacterium]|jgi:sugar phosphate isomerase/epimerase
MMQEILYTKLFRKQSLDEVGKVTQDLGFKGVDLLIRPGFHVEPDKPEEVRDAIRTLKHMGVEVPMVTTDITDPAELPAEHLFHVCAEEGVQIVRLGYWKYDPERGYQACFNTARRHLDALEVLARKTGVKLSIHLHGGTIHSSGPLTAALLAGHDPTYLGAYPDPGNQVVQEGRENWRLTLDILGPWVCCIGVKNGAWFPADNAPSGQRQWKADWVGIADGMVPWDDILPYLYKTRFNGLLSFHSHYEVPLPQVIDQTQADLNFVRRQFNEAR